VLPLFPGGAVVRWLYSSTLGVQQQPIAQQAHPSTTNPKPTRSSQLELQKFFCYSADAAIALADPRLNPGGKVVFILDVGGFGFRNWDLAGAKLLFRMIHVGAGA
jgi:hypothetical protein